MKALLITVGSRGDAEPYCAAAETLLRHGHSVELFLQKDARHLAPPDQDGLNLHELPFTTADFYRVMAAPIYGVGHSNPRVAFVGIVAHTIEDLVLPCHLSVSKAAEACDWIVCSSLARPLALAVAERYDKKVAIVHLQPLIPTALFPHYSKTNECVRTIGCIIHAESVPNPLISASSSEPCNRQTYFDLEEYQHNFIANALDKVYHELGVDTGVTFDQLKLILTGKHDRVHIVNAFSNELIPSVASDTGLRQQNVHEIGALADGYVPTSFDGAPKELVNFLRRCEDNGGPPVCIGFGSMPFDNAALILGALEECGEKAVLVGQALKIPDAYSHKAWTADNVCYVTSIPYAWLLPKCSMMISHGGAGVLHACLHAGVPAVIAPLIGDQTLWGDIVEQKGIGVRCCTNLTALTKDDVVKGIKKAAACIESAKKMGDITRKSRRGADCLLSVLSKN